MVDLTKIAHRIASGKPKPKIFSDGTKEWYLNGELHREDGPAIEWTDGRKAWYLNGRLHRVNGPAIELPNGDKEWWLNGKCHREDGPAVEEADGSKEWWLNNEQLYEVELNSEKIKKNYPDLYNSWIVHNVMNQ